MGDQRVLFEALDGRDRREELSAGLILSDDSYFTNKLPDRKYEINTKMGIPNHIELCSLSIKRVTPESCAKQRTNELN